MSDTPTVAELKELLDKTNDPALQLQLTRAYVSKESIKVAGMAAEGENHAIHLHIYGNGEAYKACTNVDANTGIHDPSCPEYKRILETIEPMRKISQRLADPPVPSLFGWR